MSIFSENERDPWDVIAAAVDFIDSKEPKDIEDLLLAICDALLELKEGRYERE